MNDASRWRQDIARQVAPAYAAERGVTAVILGGSSARGHADIYSDVELGVFWHAPPADEQRIACVERTGADLIEIYPYDPSEEVWCDDFMVGRTAADRPRSGLLVEVVHYTTDFVQRTFDMILEQYDPDLLKQNLVAGILDSIPLHGVATIHEWQGRAVQYPQELAVAVVQQHIMISHFWRWEMWLHRSENLMMLYQAFSQVQQQILHMLLGLNRVYYFGFKWIDVVAARLPIAPPDLARRFARTYQLPPADGARQLASLVEETYDLIEEHLPRVDVAWPREVFRYRRLAWEQPPPG